MSEPARHDPLGEPVDATPDAGGGHAIDPHPSAVSQPVFETRRHPFRGMLAAIPLAIGVVIIVLVTKLIELSPTPIIAVFVIVLVVGTLWGTFGPASQPKGAPPAQTTPPSPPPPEPAPGIDPVEPGQPQRPADPTTDWSAPTT